MYSNEVEARVKKKLESKLKRNMKHEAWKMKNERNVLKKPTELSGEYTIKS